MGIFVATLSEIKAVTLYLFGCQRVTVTRACVSALARWRDPFWLKRGLILNTAHRWKIVTTDASNKGCGAMCEGKPTFGLWSEEESGLHINCLEMLAVCQACQFFLPYIWVHHVLIRSDSRSVVSYINHQGGLVSKRLCTLGERPSCVGSDQSSCVGSDQSSCVGSDQSTNEGDACAGQNEPRSRHVVKEQCLFRGMDAPPAHGSENLGSL